MELEETTQLLERSIQQQCDKIRSRKNIGHPGKGSRIAGMKLRAAPLFRATQTLATVEGRRLRKNTNLYTTVRDEK